MLRVARDESKLDDVVDSRGKRACLVARPDLSIRASTWRRYLATPGVAASPTVTDDLVELRMVKFRDLITVTDPPPFRRRDPSKRNYASGRHHQPSSIADLALDGQVSIDRNLAGWANAQGIGGPEGRDHDGEEEGDYHHSLVHALHLGLTSPARSGTAIR